MDTIYGIYKTDELKLVGHRAHHAGLRHQHNITPADPEPNQTVTIHVTTLSQAIIDHVALVYTVDGSVPVGSRGRAENGTVVQFERERIEWDTLLWDYVIHWQAIIPAQTDGTLVQYIISGWSAETPELVADTPDATVEHQHATMQHYGTIAADVPAVHAVHTEEKHQIFNYHVDRWRPPQWAEWATIYHIFVDRFHPGNGQEWKPAEPNKYLRGGTLWGVRDKIDYIADLGVNAIWLSPTWQSPSYHGYNITDYNTVEPRLGGDEALRAVISAAHERGIRVLLDMVCNHLSDKHPIFTDAFADPNSQYRNWFMFDERLPYGYKTFFNVKTMPRVNLAYPAARDWMIDNALYWLREFDVDGYRLDVADGPSPAFWTHFRKACRAAKPDCLLFGEIVNTPDHLRTYAGRLDGTLDFPLNEFIRHTFGWETMTQQQLEAFIESNNAYYPSHHLRPIFLDNHDMNRFSFAAGNDIEKMKRAAVFHLALPNVAIIYYGSEVGMPQHQSIEGIGDHLCREPMVWDERQNGDLLAVYKQAIAARNQSKSLSLFPPKAQSSLFV